MRSQNVKMTAEEKLLIMTGRLTFSPSEEESIRNIFRDNSINWYELLKLSGYHKTLALSLKNIKRICPLIYPPKYLDDLVNYLSYCTSVRNYENQQQIIELQDRFLSKNITVIPVKGAYLIPNIYKDLGVRYSGDMDFLVKYDDVKIVDEIVNNLGYIKGHYNLNTRLLNKISRADEIKWKTFMSNLHPYYKLSDKVAFPYFKLDFRYALDDTLNKEPINEIVNSKIKNGYTMASHYLIHLCTHFYDEAKHTASIAVYKDLNLIKLCDIREFIITHITNEDYKQAIDFSIRHKLERALYYTMYCLSEVYNDGFENEIMNELQIKDTSFLTLFGENTKNEKYNFSKSFWERFFSCGNYDELREIPKHFEILD